MKIKYTYALLAILLLCGAACSTKKNTWASRQYHDVTAYFNVLFNGKDSYKQGLKKAEKIEPEGFDEILPVFSFEYPKAASEVSSDMQRTIEKTKKTVEKHSITAKPKRQKGMTKEDKEFYNKKEFCILIDDSYVLMGKANAFTQDYSEAQRIFEFVNTEYPKESQIYESKLWLAIMQVQQDNMGAAENTLKQLERDKKFPEKLNPLLQAAWADIKIKQKKYPDAITHLESALTKTRRKGTKIRYNYILAQLYERTGDKANALKYYDKVVKMNPPYFTAFNAEMSKALSYDTLTQKNDIRKTLEKALKDSRNEEYIDQIYYALAAVEKADNNTAKALEYYQKSISENKGNNRQLALSYNALADFYYAKPNYVKAYHYYDSAMQNIGPEHSKYEELLAKVNKLKKLALNLEIVQKQDSLQRIAQLPVEEREKLIEKKISDASAAEIATQQAQEQRQAQVALADRSKSMTETAQSTGGQWYFYNTTALSLGLTDFQMRWGKRKLEDNWRRSNKGLQAQQDILDQPDAGEEDNQRLTLTEAERQKKGLTSKDKEFYLLDLPVGDEAMKESNQLIQRAMFNVGEAYRDDIHNTTEAIKAFEELNTRYPSSNLQSASYIALYKLYTEQGNTEQANHYKNLMLANHPNDPQVKATLDPSYVVQLQAQQKIVEDEYMSAVNFYSQGNYTQAWQAAENVITSQPKNPLLPQYYLLRALSVNYSGDTVQYKTAMNEIIEKFPKSNVATQAKAMLDELGKKPTTIAEAPKQAATEQVVTVNYSAADGEHYFAILVTPKGDAAEIKFNITARNADLYLNENYEVTDENMSGGNRLVIVGVFRTKATAMRYYQDVMNKKGVFEGQPESTYTACIISATNLFLLKDSKYFTGYYTFFTKNYLNQ